MVWARSFDSRVLVVALASASCSQVGDDTGAASNASTDGGASTTLTSTTSPVGDTGSDDETTTSGVGDSSSESAASSEGTSAADESSSTGEPGNAIQTVWIILMENKNWAAIKDSESAPYLNSLLLEGAHAEAYHNVPEDTLHPSEPNYIWLEVGDALDFTDDSKPGPDNCAKGEDHLTKQLDAAGIEWRSYQEDIEGDGCPLSGVNDYAPKHNPMIFFDDVSGTDCSDEQAPVCLAHVVPYSQLADDLEQGTVARYNFLTPNLCNDMHDDCTGDRIKQGDDWLAAEVPKIQASDAYQQGGAIFITWDEGGSGNEPIGMIVLSPFARVGYSNEIEYSHSSTLRTMQTIFGVGPLLHDAANAEDLGDLFTTFP